MCRRSCVVWMELSVMMPGRMNLCCEEWHLTHRNISLIVGFICLS